MGAVRSIRLDTDAPRMPPAPPVFIGADIGQKVDPTALCVAEAVKLGHAYDYTVRHLERLPLGTPYPQVAQRIAAVVAAVANRPRPALQGAPRITLMVDSTGVGAPVIDI